VRGGGPVPDPGPAWRSRQDGSARRPQARPAAAQRDLTPVWVPDQAHEALRNLVRARADAKADELRAKHRLTKLLLRQGVQPRRMTQIRLSGPARRTRDKILYPAFVQEGG
jgi:transposase